MIKITDHKKVSSSSFGSTLTCFFKDIIKFRYLIAIIAFVILLALRVNYSSMQYWSNCIDESGQNTVAAGTVHGIRSDEFFVLAPIYLSQTQSSTPFSVVNDSITPGGHNVVTTLGAPIKNIYTLAKPCHWGFLFLPADYAFAWYWNMKIILIIMLAFELSMIITRRNELISVLGSCWIAFAPAVQWWFAQHVGDITLYLLAMVVTFYYFFRNFKSTPKKIVFAFLFSLSCVGYVTPLYPPLQVPFGFLAILLMALIFFDFHKSIKFTKADAAIIGGAFLFTVLMLGNLYLIIKDSIGPMTNTVYPGKRTCTGGGASPYYYNIFLSNYFFAQDDSVVGNTCECASCFNFLTGILLAFPIIIKKKKESLKYGIGLAAFSAFFVLYMYVGKIPVIVAKITLLSYVTSTRAMIAYSFSAMLLSIWAVAYLSRNGGIGRIYAAAVSIIVGITYIGFVYSGFQSKITELSFAGIILIFVILNYLLLRGKKYIFTPIMLCLCILSGATVNPINIGVGAITNNTLSKEIREVDKKDSSSRWIAIGGDFANILIYANGAHALGGINNYPDLSKWKLIDPNGSYEKIYNRSAHINYDLTNDAGASFKLIANNSFVVNVSTRDLKKLNVKYIVSNKDLTKFDDNTADFSELYSRDNKNFTIYRVNFK